MKKARQSSDLRFCRRVFSLLLPLLYAAILASCQKEGGDPPVAVSRVIIAYLGGDNNLSGEVEQKIAALKAGFDASASPCDRILIFHDTNGSEPILTEIYRNADRTTHTRDLKTYDGYNSADGATLAEVVADARRLYPDARYGLLVFSHASGWLPEGMYLNPLLPPDNNRSRSIIRDGASRHTELVGSYLHTQQQTQFQTDTRSIIRDGANEMEITELAAALPNGVFDYIVFETCFMAGVETVWELRNKAPLIVASSAEIVSPGFTELYPAALGHLLTGNVEQFAKAAFAAVEAQTGWRRSATYSLIRTAELESLRNFIAENADFSRPVDVFDVQRFDRNTYRLFFDMEDYYARLLDSDAQRTELSGLIVRCVAWRAATPEFMSGHGGFTITKHCGLTVYIPQPEFDRLNRTYAQLDWSIGMKQ